MTVAKWFGISALLFVALSEEVKMILAEQQIKPLSEYSDFSQHKTGGTKVKGIWISGSKATVFLKKEEKEAPKTETENAQVQIEKIKQRLIRNKELDGEKVYAKILEAMLAHPSQKKGFNRKMTPSEEVFLWFIVLDRAGYPLQHELRKYIVGTKDTPEVLYDRLKKMKPEDKAFLLRKVMLAQYEGKSPESDHGRIIYKIRNTATSTSQALKKSSRRSARNEKVARRKE